MFIYLFSMLWGANACDLFYFCYPWVLFVRPRGLIVAIIQLPLVHPFSSIIRTVANLLLLNIRFGERKLTLLTPPKTGPTCPRLP